MKTTAALAGLVALVVLALSGCGAAPSSTNASSSTTTAQVDSWATWAKRYEDKISECPPEEDDDCFSRNHVALTEMRTAILDNNLPIDENANIATPMDMYQDTYADFVSLSCANGPREAARENVQCNVKRQQMRTIGKSISQALQTLSVS